MFLKRFNWQHNGRLRWLTTLVLGAAAMLCVSVSGATEQIAQSPRTHEESLAEPAPILGGMPTPPADRILRAQSEAILDDPAALLRAAAKGIEQQDDSHADWLYAQIAQRHPIVGDYAGLRRARLQLSKGRALEARQIAARVLEDYPSSPLRAELYEIVGEALIAERDEVGAREAWAAALAETTEDDRRAALLRRVARSEERSGEDRAAATTWRLIWYAHPASAAADQASHRLDVIEAYLGETLRRHLCPFCVPVGFSHSCELVAGLGRFGKMLEATPGFVQRGRAPFGVGVEDIHLQQRPDGRLVFLLGE